METTQQTVLQKPEKCISGEKEIRYCCQVNIFKRRGEGGGLFQAPLHTHAYF